MASDHGGTFVGESVVKHYYRRTPGGAKQHVFESPSELARKALIASTGDPPPDNREEEEEESWDCPKCGRLLSSLNAPCPGCGFVYGAD